MIEPTEEQPDEIDAPTEDSNKPLAWFFIIMILINPFLAPLLTLLLKANIEPPVTVLDDEIPEEPDFSWDFLRFPMAAAAPTHTTFDQEMPEFHQGTNLHNAKNEKAMKKTMEEIHAALDAFLDKPTTNTKVVVVGENHIDFFEKITLLNYLKQRQVSKKTTGQIKFLYEMPWTENTVITDDAIKLRDRLHEDPKHARQYLPRYLKRNCIDNDDPSSSLMPNATNQNINIRQICGMFAIGSYGFNLALSLSETKPKSSYENAVLANHFNEGSHTISIFIPLPENKARRTTLHGFNFIFTLTIIEQGVIDALQKQLKSSTSSDVIVVITGALHLKGVKQSINTYPHRLLNFGSATSKREIDDTEREATQACLVKIEDCPTDIQRLLKKHHATFYAVPNPTDTTKCDPSLKWYRHREDYAKNSTIVFQVSPLRSNEPIVSITDFWAPKSVIKALKAKWGQDRKEQEEVKHNNRRNEL